MPFLGARGKSKKGESSTEDVENKKGDKDKHDWKDDITFTLPPLIMRFHDDGTWRPCYESGTSSDTEVCDNDKSKFDRLFRENETLKEKNNMLKLKVETLIEMIVRKNIEIKRLQEEKK